MLSLFFFLISSIGCVVTANLIRSKPHDIVDIVHSNLPRIQAPYLSDILVLAQTIGTVAIMDVNMFSEMLMNMGIVQLFRIVCSVSTALPPLKNYHDKYRMGGINGTGTEYIFSGHASYSALTAIYLYRGGIVTLLPLFVYNFISQSLIVLTHNHYTVDVILAWIIVPLVYGNIVSCRKIEACNEILQPLL